MVLATIAVLMTIAVYGIVAGIVKLDDLGLRLSKRRRPLARGLGGFLMAAAPKLMRALTIIGTIAMFMVGGGILSHGFPPLHHLSERAAEAARGIPGAGGVLARSPQHWSALWQGSSPGSSCWWRSGWSRVCCRERRALDSFSVGGGHSVGPSISETNFQVRLTETTFSGVTSAVMLPLYPLST